MMTRRCVHFRPENIDQTALDKTGRDGQSRITKPLLYTELTRQEPASTKVFCSPKTRTDGDCKRFANIWVRRC
jgi:hypothetical protein